MRAATRPEQRLDLPLRRIVPEYRSRNALVRWLFHERLGTAARYVAAVRPDALIDIGCGEGRFLQLLNELDVRVPVMWGIDLNPNVSALAVPNCTFAQRDVVRTGFADAAFGAVACLDILEHVPALPEALAEIRRIVRPGGHLITSEPVESGLYKALRFLLKGTTSQVAGPGAGGHYGNAQQIHRIVVHSGFTLLRSRRLPCPPPLDLFHVNLYVRVEE
jgi:SAM-dependent methyltransferase